MQGPRALHLATWVRPVFEQQPHIVMVALEGGLMEGGEASIVLVHGAHAQHVQGVGHHVRVTHLARSVEDSLASVFIHNPPVNDKVKALQSQVISY